MIYRPVSHIPSLHSSSRKLSTNSDASVHSTSDNIGSDALEVVPNPTVQPTKVCDMIFMT